MQFGLAMRAGLVACATLATALLGLAGQASAQIGSERYAAIVLDHGSGRVLVAANADETRHPASLTKMMTLYMVFEALRDGQLTLNSRVPISAEAASRPPSKLGVPAGQSISVEQAILALVTRSANDVATAVGERLGGSEARFAQMMTLRARGLGMDRTTFRNASGLPDAAQITTARDMATLGRRIFQDFPDRYHYFGISHAQFGGVRIRNHNRMLESYGGVDGIKTGYINASGFNIVTSASRGGQRLVGAVFGGSSWSERDGHMAALLDRGFSQLGVTHTAATGPVLVRSAAAAALPRAAAASPTRRATRSARPATRRTSQARQQATTRRTATQAARRPAAQPARTTASRRAASAQGSRSATTRRSTPARAARTTATRNPPARAASTRRAPAAPTRSALAAGRSRTAGSALPAPVPRARATVPAAARN
ncbi:MAG TPA: serine hydrolase [Falsiroseomonas sp.]|jgi:D-alanyl-D-alanine carboxypeptidase|nr:serine hydrolase [Falsiroseomonas sp.]